MKKKGISTYTHREKHEISSETIHHMKHNKSVTLTKLNELCNILQCEVWEIIKYEKDK